MNICTCLLFIIFVTSLQRSTWAYMWPLVWSGPHPESQNDGAEEGSYIYPRNTQENRVNDTVRNVNIVPCDRDKSCGKGLFCDLHYGGCRRHKSVGEPCRRDGHCTRGTHCRFGTCQTAIAEGMLGARCRSDKDCGDSQCCAKQHGESICKAKLQVGAKCFVPEGGIEYVIDSICPCDASLVCRLVQHHRRPNGRAPSNRYWNGQNHMRCQAV
ncbi:uncharacterized protein [Apostichopus japonicus]|uniref:uncharacterized protein n=1 Tax=Stichopus japonicus TaxID=307972 RepID=UPI003AB2B0D9